MRVLAYFFLCLGLFSVALAQYWVSPVSPEASANRAFFMSLSKSKNLKTPVKPELKNFLPKPRYVKPVLKTPVKPKPIPEVVEPAATVIPPVVVEPEPTEPPIILVIAPHPDDEILCCASTIQNKLDEGYTVKVLYFTNGDSLGLVTPAEAQAYGQTRKAESLRALKKLGIPTEDAVWLNFPDRELAKLNDGPITSRYTGQSRTNLASAFPSTDYTEDNLIGQVSHLIKLYDPEEVFLPHPYQDKHKDHRYASQLTLNVLRQQPDPTDVYTYNIHGSAQKRWWKEPDAVKLELIRVFESQFHDDHHEHFLENFAYRPELLKPYPLD